MPGTQSWWRRLGAALAALVLCVFTFGPSLEAWICGAEAGFSAAADELPEAAAPTPDQHDSGHPDDGPGACVHGHCHHGSVVVVPAEGARSQSPLVQDTHELVQVRVRTSDPKF